VTIYKFSKTGQLSKVGQLSKAGQFSKAGDAISSHCGRSHGCYLAMGMISLPASMLALNCKILLLSPAMPILASMPSLASGGRFLGFQLLLCILSLLIWLVLVWLKFPCFPCFPCLLASLFGFPIGRAAWSGGLAWRPGLEAEFAELSAMV
jgi:hypothetical protein